MRRQKFSLFLKLVFHFIALAIVLILVYILVNIGPEPNDDKDILKKHTEIDEYLKVIEKEKRLRGK